MSQVKPNIDLTATYHEKNEELNEKFELYSLLQEGIEQAINGETIPYAEVISCIQRRRTQ